MRRGALVAASGYRNRSSGPLTLFRQVLSGSATTAVTLTTATGTQVGDQLVCIRMTDAFTNSASLTAPTGTAGTWAQQGADITATDNAPRVRVWTRTVAVAGAQTVTCSSTTKANHVVLYVLPSGRAVNSVTTSFGTGTGTTRVAPSGTATDDAVLICCGAEYDAPDFTAFGTLALDAEIVSNASSAWAASQRVGAGATGTRTVTKAVGSPWWVTASVVGSLTGSVPPPEVDGTLFPLLGGMLIGSPHNYNNSSYRLEVAKLDLAILGMYNGWNGGASAMATSVNAIKAINPDILLGNYTIMTEVPTARSNSATTVRWDKLTNQVGPNGVGNWWAYNAAGQHTDWAGGTFNTWDTNCTLQVTPDSNGDRWPQYAAKLDYTQILNNINWDIWYCDNNFWKPRSDADWDRSGTNDSQNNETIRNLWRDGQRAYYDTAKATAPGLEVMVNADSDLDGAVHPGEAEPYTQYQSVVHGAFLEHAIGKDWSVETWGGWATMMAWYRATRPNLLDPRRVVLDVYMGDNPTDYKTLRYAFASALLENGYFSASSDYNQVLWFDEYDLAGTATTKWLGAAVDGPQTSPYQLGVYRRTFANGTVLVNPKGNGVRTVTIESGWRRFSGTQAPTVNNGQPATSITLADRDAIFLVKVAGSTPPTVPPGALEFTATLTSPVQATDPTWCGVCSSQYGALPSSVPAQAAAEQALDARYWRIPVKWNGTQVVSSAAGTGSSQNALPVIQLYQSWGHRMILVIAGRTDDYAGYVSGDAAAIVNHLIANGVDMSKVDISGPNEINNIGQTISAFNTRATAIYNELQTPLPGKKVWGPVWTHHDGATFQSYMDAMGVTRFGGIDYHNYAIGGDGTYTSAQTILSETPTWAQQVGGIRSDLAARGLPLNVNVDELNFSWRYNVPPHGNVLEFFQAENTLWQASVHGHILRAGGRGMTYATQNGPLGVMVEAGNEDQGRAGSSPMPAYWGIAAWTGGGAPGGPRLFPHFKDAFYATTTPTSMVELFAVNNESGGYNLVCLNKSDTARDVRITLTGLSGAWQYDLWQTVRANPYNTPVKLRTGVSAPGYVGFPAPAVTWSVIQLRQ
jgi:hypothetical protein